MAGDALTPVHQLRYRRRDPCFERLTDQGLRHAVAVALDLDVVVDVDLDGLEVRHLVTL